MHFCTETYTWVFKIGMGVGACTAFGHGGRVKTELWIPSALRAPVPLLTYSIHHGGKHKHSLDA